MLLLTEYVSEVQTRIEALKDSLANGSAQSFEEYTKRVGTIGGLKQAISILENLVKTKPREER